MTSLPVINPNAQYSEANRFIDGVNLCITSICQMKCPHCCCNTQSFNKGAHGSWDYFVHAAKFLYGIKRIHLTGGEPTLHPKFVELAPRWRDLFGCEELTVETNGWGCRKFPEAFGHFDWVLITGYTEDHHEGCKDNSADGDALLRHFAGKDKPLISYHHVPHIPRDTRRGTKMCSRGLSGQVSYWNRLLYPCCVGPGVARAAGIPLTPNWREEILQVEIPCGDCWFAVE